jgi:CheY-like chemotaxis protein
MGPPELPAEEETTVVQIERKAHEPRTLTGRRVLIIEDHADGREILRILLELLGCQVEVAADGVQGVIKALTGNPEIALVDIGLPRLDGYQVARKLRAALGRKIFLIAQTGYGQPQDREQALQAGFDAHLVKPVDLKDLTYWLNAAG